MLVSRAITLLLIGILIGTGLGVEAHKYALGDVCPTPTCIDSSRAFVVTDNEYAPQAIKMLAEAESSIDMALFELKFYKRFPRSPSNKLVEEIIEAHERGVAVRIIVDEFAKDNSALPLLADKGIAIRNDGDNRTLHAKLIVCDHHRILVGSTNPTYYGLEKNREANLYLEDERIAREYEQWINNIWQDIPGSTDL